MPDKNSIPVDYHALEFGPSFSHSRVGRERIDAFRAQLPAPALADFMDIWLAVLPDAGVPPKRDMTPERMSAHLGYLGIMELKDDPLDVVFRLAGIHIVEALGFEMTGQSLHRSIPRDQGFADRYDMFWRPVFECGKPRYDRAHLGPVARKHLRYHALHLPVADDAGVIRYSVFRFLPD